MGVSMMYFGRRLLRVAAATAVTLAVAMAAPAALAAKGGKGKGGGGGGGPGGGGGGLVSVKSKDWNELAVRKVLHVFAYGGHASDAQIQTWAGMRPQQAIAEMLTFDIVNEKLSPVEDASPQHAGSLAQLQAFWSSDDPANPVRLDKRAYYAVRSGDTNYFNRTNLQRTWFQAVSTRGINPVPHLVAFYLTNHHMAIHFNDTGALMRDYYEEIYNALVAGDDLTQILYLGASSAAVARHYGHQYNYFYNNSGTFSGNDDFAREFHQLFFRIQGETEDFDYHENVTIENTAHVLTGMNIDREPGAFGGNPDQVDYVSPIDFSDHYDQSGRYLRNLERHHADCLEAYQTVICGTTADEKIFELSQVAATHPEALANIPVTIIGYIADDSLTPDKIAQIQGTWAGMATKDILELLRAYATSTAFHSESTVKYATAFNRNITVWNKNMLTNAGNHAHGQHARYPTQLQGAEVFEPARFVFGTVDGRGSANIPDLFLKAYNRRVTNAWNLYNADEYPSETNGLTEPWLKDWGAVIPTTNGQYRVGDVADWLWNHVVADGGKNFGPIERAHVQSLLATGRDFGWRMEATGNAPDRMGVYGTAELTDSTHPAYQVDQDHADMTLDLTSADTGTRAWANSRVGYAINFIAATPFVFAYEGK